jgi:hypothetical protein
MYVNKNTRLFITYIYLRTEWYEEFYNPLYARGTTLE